MLTMLTWWCSAHVFSSISVKRVSGAPHCRVTSTSWMQLAVFYIIMEHDCQSELGMETIHSVIVLSQAQNYNILGCCSNTSHFMSNVHAQKFVLVYEDTDLHLENVSLICMFSKSPIRTITHSDSHIFIHKLCIAVKTGRFFAKWSQQLLLIAQRLQDGLMHAHILKSCMNISNLLFNYFLHVMLWWQLLSVQRWIMTLLQRWCISTWKDQTL